MENYSSINRNKYNIYISKRKNKENTQYDNQFNEISYKKCIDMSILYNGEQEKKIKKKDLKNTKIKFNENVYIIANKRISIQRQKKIYFYGC